ncbi:unnamed protein product [Amoebophrya sp. A120]|nr:unnamed protein product [Amoebophrya sp. A120]|eukprot:GSA120T00006992001.1
MRGFFLYLRLLITTNMVVLAECRAVLFPRTVFFFLHPAIILSLNFGNGGVEQVLASEQQVLFPQHKKSDWVNCEQDPEWASFRRLLMRELQANNMEPTEQLVQAATSLMVSRIGDPSLQPSMENYMGYSPAMSDFLNNCNQQKDFKGEDPHTAATPRTGRSASISDGDSESESPSSLPQKSQQQQPVCLYGVISALWVLAYSQWGQDDGKRLLQHAKFLLGQHTRYCLDFLDASHWTVSSLDILSQKETTQAEFRNPVSLPPVVVPANPIVLDYEEGGFVDVDDLFTTSMLVSGSGPSGAGGKNGLRDHEHLHANAPPRGFAGPGAVGAAAATRSTTVGGLGFRNTVDTTNIKNPDSLITNRPLRVWELGVHASLSAEPLNIFASFVTGKFEFVNLIEDQYPAWLPDKWNTLYGEQFGATSSGPAATTTTPQQPGVDAVTEALKELFRYHIPHSASSKDPIIEFDLLQQQFREIVTDRDVVQAGLLPDFYLCTILVLCLLPPEDETAGDEEQQEQGSSSSSGENHEGRHRKNYKQARSTTRKNLLGYFGHPMLFMVGESQRDYVFRQFRKLLTANKNNVFSVSDPFLQMQYEYQTGFLLPHIRQHASYISIGTSWNFKRELDILVIDRPHESVLLCMLQYFIDRWDDGHGNREQHQTRQTSESDGSTTRPTASSTHKNFYYDNFPPQAKKPYENKKLAAEGRLRLARAGLEYDLHPERFPEMLEVNRLEGACAAGVKNKPGGGVSGAGPAKTLNGKQAQVVAPLPTTAIDVEEEQPEDSAEAAFGDYAYAKQELHDHSEEENSSSYVEYLKKRKWELKQKRKDGGKEGGGTITKITVVPEGGGAATAASEGEEQQLENGRRIVREDNLLQQADVMHRNLLYVYGSKSQEACKMKAAKAAAGVKGPPSTYPFQFITRQLTQTRSFEEFSEFRSVVLFPYDMDLITFYEFYHLNIPLFLPNHLSKYMFSQDHNSYNFRDPELLRETPPRRLKLWPYSGRGTMETGTASEDDARHDEDRVPADEIFLQQNLSPFEEDNVDAVFEILKFTDYFRYPGVQYFINLPDLLHKLVLPEFNSIASLQKISNVMKRFNLKSLQQSVTRWERVLETVIGSEAQFRVWKQAEY